MDASPEKPYVRVVAALVEQDERFLVAQRRPDSRLSLLWEFPGGRVEPGESDAAALQRELAERMAVQVEVGDLFLHVTRRYRRYDIDFWVYRCTIVGPEPRPVRVNALRWADLDELGALSFPGVDQDTVDALLEDVTPTREG
ncbi:MAG: (deoxy)nucleoside triphosphate pyrophosphohydrolase [Deltaproteobacteria bacterium]|nr:(deoxy)nucleoside triphosphate pyrophosphohydrolase [Deltaproteobacteria bacterium]